ncbi:MAG TPA: thiamine-phosphate kinase [Opitutales bacterium]|jgi:thiamine-monophosphate kinase|nr:thiamine-phosphate kinase [Opitutales bacterium]
MKPFSKMPAETVAHLGEIALLQAIRGWLGDVSPPSPHGIGDDCAVLDLHGASSTLATVDGVVYGRHFDDSAPPASVGAKLLKRNLSDIAAMGGIPKHALVHLTIGCNLSTAWIKKFYTGLAQCCREFGVTLAGGGTAQGPDDVFAADLTLLGTAGPKVLLRTGAQIGDAIFVTGDLGGSIFGKHLDFTPRLAEGQWLAKHSGVRALIDVTDGLAKDLPAILPKNADARLHTSTLPISYAAKKLARRDRQSALLHALTDGEDYELLFAVNASADWKSFTKSWKKSFQTPLTQIGVIAPALQKRPDRQLREAATGQLLLPAGKQGFEHLR